MRSLWWSNSQNRKPMMGYRGWGGAHGDRVSVWEDEKVLEMDGGDGCHGTGH